MRCDMLFNTALSVLLAAGLAQAGPVPRLDPRMYESCLLSPLSLWVCFYDTDTLCDIYRPKVARAETSIPGTSESPSRLEYVVLSS